MRLVGQCLLDSSTVSLDISSIDSGVIERITFATEEIILLLSSVHIDYH
jgi:hypothetical protein